MIVQRKECTLTVEVDSVTTVGVCFLVFEYGCGTNPEILTYNSVCGNGHELIVSKRLYLHVFK